MANKILKSVLLILLLSFSLSLNAQSDSRYNSDLNLPFNEKAGDVNPQTGDITLSAGDVSLPGRGGLNFSFSRIWSGTQSNVFNMIVNNGGNDLDSNTVEKNSHLGVGWRSSIPFINKIDNDQFSSLNLFYGGGVYQIETANLDNNSGRVSNLMGYDLLDLVIYYDRNNTYENLTAKLAELRSAYPHLLISDSQSNEYALRLKDNSFYYFDNEGKLLKQTDKTGLNSIHYFYDVNEHLRLVLDSVGREVAFSYDLDGNLTEIKWDVVYGVLSDTVGGELGQALKESRTVKYTYEKAKTLFPSADWSSYNEVIEYREPFVLVSVQSPYDQVSGDPGKEKATETRYDYEIQSTKYSFNKNTFVDKSNLHILINSIASAYSNDVDGQRFLNKRVIEYSYPENGRQRKDFYSGYMEFFRVSKEYHLDRHSNRELNPTSYTYLEEGEQGFQHSYRTIISQGKVDRSYIYSVNGEYKSRNNVLYSVLTTSDDGFNEEKVFQYNQFRTKTKDIIKRNGLQVYEESFNYDEKSNLTWKKDRSGLEVQISYFDKFDVPRETIKILKVDGTEKRYKSENVIDHLGRVIEQHLYLDNSAGDVIVSKTKYDDLYGNVIEQTDFKGNISYIEYDTTYNLFPVKNYSNVEIPIWTNVVGAAHWTNETDPQIKSIVIQNMRKFNSDGTVWIEIDNDGFALEHYYDKMGQEIKTVNPNSDDDISLSYDDIKYIEFSPTDLSSPGLKSFLASRVDNPGVSMEIHYQEGMVKTYADIDKTSGSQKVSAVFTDGLGHTEKELEYGEGLLEYSKTMTYDNLGRMIALTDADASDSFVNSRIHGTDFQLHDKTWIVKYDDLGRQVKVIYPVTEKGSSPGIKKIAYDDLANIITTTDPEGRVAVQHMDWAGNLFKLEALGDYKTPVNDRQTYEYTYDELNRKTQFTDPKGIVTKYYYNERDLLIEQKFETKSDFMSYDVMGQLIKKVDRKGQVIAFEYDDLGRNTEVLHYLSEADLTAGVLDNAVTTAYDHRGNAVRIDNQNLIEYYQYDFANRVTTLNRKLKDELVDIRTSIATVWGGNQATDTFDFSYEYNDAGMVTSMTYPDGSVHSFDYDNYMARLQGINEQTFGELTATPFVTGLDYNKAGVVTEMTMANNVIQSWEFDNRKRINHINIKKVVDPNATVLTYETIEDMVYKLNKSGDILSINENEYSYDGFDRIIGAKTFLPNSENDPTKLVAESFGTYLNNDPIDMNGEPRSYDALADLNLPVADGKIDGIDHILASFTDEGTLYDRESFTYDKNGNRTKLVQNDDIYTYVYGERNRLLSVFLKKKGDSSAAEFISYKYDDNGNMTERTIMAEGGDIVVSFAYDTLNRLVKTTESGVSTKYHYDNAGNRFIKEAADGAISFYLRHGQIAVALDIEVNSVQTSEMGKINRYVLSGDLIAGRVTRVVHTDTTKVDARSYYHLDHLNSTKLVTDKDGLVEASYTYRAFGEQLNDLQDADATYTYGGKELDSNTNLYYFNARYYDATIGRFINVDPIQDGSNWYVYVNNNPLSMVDPTGLDSGGVTPEIIEESYNNVSAKLKENGYVKKPAVLKQASDSIKRQESILEYGNYSGKGYTSGRHKGDPGFGIMDVRAQDTTDLPAIEHDKAYSSTDNKVRLEADKKLVTAWASTFFKKTEGINIETEQVSQLHAKSYQAGGIILFSIFTIARTGQEVVNEINSQVNTMIENMDPGVNDDYKQLPRYKAKVAR